MWLHGSQSTTTGGRVARNGHICAMRLLVRAEHALRVDDALGLPVEPEVKSTLAMVSGPSARSGLDARGRARAASASSGGAAPAAAAAHDAARRGRERGEGALVAIGVGRVDQPGREDARDRAELGEVLARPSVYAGETGADRARRVHRGEREQRVIDAVPGEDAASGALGREAAIEQRLGEARRAAAPRRR